MRCVLETSDSSLQARKTHILFKTFQSRDTIVANVQFFQVVQILESL